MGRSSRFWAITGAGGGFVIALGVLLGWLLIPTEQDRSTEKAAVSPLASPVETKQPVAVTQQSQQPPQKAEPMVAVQPTPKGLEPKKASPVPRDISKMHLVVDVDFSKPGETAIHKDYDLPDGFPERDVDWITCARIGDEWSYTGKKNGYWLALPQAGMDALRLRDFIFEADYRIPEAAGADSGRGWILAVCSQGVPAQVARLGDTNFYLLEGQTGVAWDPSETWPIPLAKTPALRAPPSPNTARLECFSGTLRLFINGQFVGEVFDNRYRPSGFLLYLQEPKRSARTEVRFRRIRVWCPEPRPAVILAQRPTPSAPATASPNPPPTLTSLDDWMQDFEQAKQRASKEGKDVLIFFDGSDWCGWCMKLTKEVFIQPDFQRYVADKFVLVHLDFPERGPAKSKVANPKQNEQLLKTFRVDGFPTVVLTDSQGRRYALNSYQSGGAVSYCALLDKARSVREQRDNLFGDIARQQGKAQLEAAKKALGFLDENELTTYYRTELEEWSKLASRYDPNNQQGEAEIFFAKYWKAAFDQTSPENAAELTAVVGKLDAWKKNNRFKNKDCAAELYLLAGVAISFTGNAEQSAKYFKAGLSLNPADEKLKERLSLAALGKVPIGSGTGFVVAPGGYILTNHHVAKPPGRIRILFPGVNQPIPAKLVASDDKRDIALLKLDAQAANLSLGPLRLSTKPAELGQDVAILGYPQGVLRQNRGSISALLGDQPNSILALDLRVNPGNSGGPLFDARGNVVGMVFAKRRQRDNLESEGYAIPSPDLDKFLQKNCKSYTRRTMAGKRIEWEEILGKAKPAVVRVLKVL